MQFVLTSQLMCSTLQRGCNVSVLSIFFSFLFFQSAAAAPSPVMGGMPPGEGMPGGPMPPGFFQVSQSPLWYCLTVRNTSLHYFTPTFTIKSPFKQLSKFSSLHFCWFQLFKVLSGFCSSYEAVGLHICVCTAFCLLSCSTLPSELVVNSHRHSVCLRPSSAVNRQAWPGHFP